MRSLFLSFLFLGVLLSGYAQNYQQDSTLHLWNNLSAPHSNHLTGEEVEEQPNRIARTTEAVLYLFRANPERTTGQAVVLCPGGAYRRLAIDNEGYVMARWLAEEGITCAVLKYRMPNGHPEVPLEDACQAIRLLRGKVEGIPAEWQVKTVGIAGSSAGGHLAAMTSTMGEERPDFSLLFYPVITATEGQLHKGSFDNLLGKGRSKKQSTYYSLENRVTAQTPPAFILYADDDRTVPSVNGPLYYMALKKQGIRGSLHIFPYGGHGFGMRDTFHYKHAWMPLMLDWIDTILK